MRTTWCPCGTSAISKLLKRSFPGLGEAGSWGADAAAKDQEAAEGVPNGISCLEEADGLKKGSRTCQAPHKACHEKQRCDVRCAFAAAFG